MYFLELIFLIIINSSCVNFDNYDGYEKVQDTELGSSLTLSKFDTVVFTTDGEGIRSKQKGVFIKYHKRNQTDTIFIWYGTDVIVSHVNEIKGDKMFLLIDQKPLDSIFGKYVRYGDYNIRPNKPERYDEVVEKLKNSNIHQYWIIDKGSNDVYGGYSELEYLRMRKSLKVSEKLKLDFEE